MNMKLITTILLLTITATIAKTSTPTPKPKATATPIVAPVPKRPTPAPTPTPVTSLTVPVVNQANIEANRAINQLNTVAANLTNALANGIPSRGNQPAVSAADFRKAIGDANAAKIEAALKALK